VSAGVLRFAIGSRWTRGASTLACAIALTVLAPIRDARSDTPTSVDRGNRLALPQPPRGTPRDALGPLIRRMERYLRHHEENGVTMDWRYQVSPSEEIRQSVVCQLLAYVELSRMRPQPRLRRETVGHADFLLGRLEEVRSHTPFDGMLAYSLLAAYETCGEPRFLEAGSRMASDLMAIPTSQCVLNGGLMVAMATAEYARLTGDAGALQKTRDILAQLVAYQNPDGSFPHWCIGSRDIHYTGWMSMELIHIQRLLDDPNVAPMLERAASFLAGRVAADGRSTYEEPCPTEPPCTAYYYSRATGCSYDYDTRGWTVEPAYLFLALEHAGSPKAPVVMEFLRSLESGGTFSDLYAYWPPPEDPEYPWTIADTSVVNMSIIFWALTTTAADRIRRGITPDLVLDDEVPPPPAVPASLGARSLTAEPNPARGTCSLRFTLAEPAEVKLEVHDVAGRCVRVIQAGTLGAGTRTAWWDGCDLAGRPVPNGVYFLSLITGTRERVQRLLLVR
jgi:flagellar hook capping protein FlgD